MKNISPTLRDRARILRATQTDTERLFWQIVKNKGFGGLKFRRQHVIGRYIIDFYCAEKRLAVEFDGGGHNEPEQHRYDIARDKFLAANGVTVLRYWNNQLFEETESVLNDIWEWLHR